MTYKKGLLVLFIFLGLSTNFYLLLNKNNKNFNFINEKVCGLVIRLDERYQNRGVSYYSIQLRLEKYGFVSYRTDANFKDNFFNLDFSKLKKDQNICFIVKKPTNIKNWNNKFSILEILN